VAAATALNLPLGALYAFSVLLKPLEALLGLGRADLALVFGLAAAGFAVGMTLTPLTFGLASPAMLVLGGALLGALGVALAASAGGLPQLALGYGVLFGLSWGVAYVLLLQIVNLAVATRRGLVNGYMVSLFPMGAMLAAPLFGWGIRAVGVRVTLGAFALVLLVTGLASAWLTARSGVALPTAAASVALEAGERRRPVFWRLWLIFFLAASSGLMVLSQAAGIIAAYGGATALAVTGTTLITGLIAAARLGGGWMADWLSIPTVAAGAHLLAVVGGLALTFWPGPVVAVIGLALVGIGYGLVSGLTAAAVAAYWRLALYGRIASRIYIAWSAAAILLPIVAGRLFDVTGGYGAAVLVAAAGNALGVLVAFGLPRQAPASRGAAA
jgi:OFA family oxalate/formate antiporter-like MFS transporter